MSLILFVDDEPRRVAPWVDALREAFGTVEFRGGVGAALSFLDEDPRPVDLLVWDMMMPTEAGMTDEQTAYGTRTGRVVHARFRQRHSEKPAILLTNARDDGLFAEVRRGLHDHAGRKRDLTPSKLVDLVASLGLPRVDAPA